MSMKYDAGMTQYHDDIVSALRDMLHGEIDKIAELAAEGSPVPLREYLRNNHGKKSHGGNKFDAMSSCFLVIFDHVINNEGDSKLDLSWSQVAMFIRKYPSDFFKKNDDKEAFPCDDCGYDKHGCCNYPDTPDDYCVMGNKKSLPNFLPHSQQVILLFSITPSLIRTRRQSLKALQPRYSMSEKTTSSQWLKRLLMHTNCLPIVGMASLVRGVKALVLAEIRETTL